MVQAVICPPSEHNTRRHPGAVTRSALAATALALLTACGGGGGGGGASSVAPAPPPASGFDAGEFEDSNLFADMCAAPRSGNFPDVAGSTEDENNWLRSWSNELYLWYDEITDEDPAAFTTPEYFDLMRTFQTTASGAPKDQFHFTIPTDEYEALAQSGISAGYGAEFALLSASPPREIVVAFTNPNTPAANAGLVRGTQIVTVDGVDVENGADVDTLNAGLFPSAANESYTFGVVLPGQSAITQVSLTSQEITSDPVQFDQVISTPTGDVGYLFFSDHIAPAEAELVTAMAGLENAGVTDLILDIRYNGGGFLDIANMLAYMIAGPSAASGRIFEEIQFNDKHTVRNPVTGQALSPTAFHETTQGFSLAAGQALPSLNLSRVFVLTTAGTCSASEAIINGLRGIGVEVIQIGSTTCGKPYGFYATDNCGTTYFSIQFRGINAVGFGDYADGFTPSNSPTVATSVTGCSVADDYGNALGDPNEDLLATALDYRDTANCPPATGQIRILSNPDPALSLSAPPKAGAVLLR
ncbi:MAG: S41 family peptidase [Pseudomonadaceae bacterium]|nr:S41 family peptidase [Pseudomonadaceae bacterium]